MRYNLRELLSLLLPLCLVNCSADTSESMDKPSGSQPAYSFDVSALAIPPPAILPTTRLSSGAFEQTVIARTLIGTTEAFSTVNQIDDRIRSESKSYTLEVDSRKGQLLLLSKLSSGSPGTVSEGALTQQSLARLASWGVPEAELGTVLQRRVLREDGTVNLPADGPVLHRYKTFVNRAIGGIPIQGHRAVLTYTPDAVFHRALIVWPPLAPDGHQLSTTLTVTDIQSRTISELRKAGYPGGQVKLSWKYLASPTLGGDVTLRLVVSAQSRSEPRGIVGTEPRELDIDVTTR